MNSLINNGYEFEFQQNPSAGLIIARFESLGKKAITKIIQLELVQDIVFEELPVYSLGFGDFINGELNDEILSKNGDSDKVFATLINFLETFLYNNPLCYIYFSGNTETKIRAYRRIIFKYSDLVSRNFIILGFTGDDFVKYEHNQSFEGFIIRRR